MDKIIYFLLGGSIVLNIVFIFCALIVAKQSDFKIQSMLKKDDQKEEDFWLEKLL